MPKRDTGRPAIPLDRHPSIFSCHPEDQWIVDLASAVIYSAISDAAQVPHSKRGFPKDDPNLPGARQNAIDWLFTDEWKDCRSFWFTAAGAIYDPGRILEAIAATQAIQRAKMEATREAWRRGQAKARQKKKGDQNP